MFYFHDRDDEDDVGGEDADVGGGGDREKRMVEKDGGEIWRERWREGRS